VPIYAEGPGAGMVSTTMENTDVFKMIAQALAIGE
jgi:alkaline phosphatase